MILHTLFYKASPRSLPDLSQVLYELHIVFTEQNRNLIIVLLLLLKEKHIHSRQKY